MSSVQAGELEVAEHARLRAEMDALVERGAWSGVERAFLSIEALEASGELLTFSDLYIGAQASLAQGDVRIAKDRLARALEREQNAEAAMSLRQLDLRFAPVSLRVVDGAARILSAETIPFEPDARAAIDRAATALQTTGSYEGLLPAGTYVLGGARFRVETTPGVLAITAAPPPPPPPVAAPTPLPRPEAPGLRWGARAVLGPAFTASTSMDADPQQPPALSGPGLHGAAGLELLLTRHLGLSAELGAHTLSQDADNGLNLGFAAVSGVWSAGRVRVGLGGGGGLGALSARGLDDPDALAVSCPYGSAAEECAWIAAVPLDDREDYLWSGTLALGGAQGSLGLALFDLGEQMTGGLAVQGGVWLDTWHAWPWAHLGFEIRSKMD